MALAKKISYEVLTKTEGPEAGEFMISIHPQGKDVSNVKATIKGLSVEISYSKTDKIILENMPKVTLAKISKEEYMLIGEMSDKGIEKAYDVAILATL